MRLKFLVYFLFECSAKVETFEDLERLFYNTTAFETISERLRSGNDIINSGRECNFLHFGKNCRFTFRRQCDNAERSVP